ncbi:LamG domain-containing protein, partial [Akkermansiaceae bacterium]|nr:LamG domain-containing protein [Akkermansiaceae bacterium]
MKQQLFTVSSMISLLASSASWADYPGVVNADGPLAYYRFEEAAGATTLVDSSGNGLDIDYSAPIGTTQLGEPGAIGLAALFNTDGSILTPLLLDPSVGDFTIEAIVRADSPEPAGSVVVSNQDGTGGPGRSNLVVDGGRRITTYIGGLTVLSGRTATVDSFDHIIATYDQSAAGGGDPTIRIFINGEETGSGTLVAEAANGGWVIGSHKSQASQFFSGIIDEVAIYGKRLDDPNGDGDVSDSRVTAHFKEYLADSDTVINFSSDVRYLDGGQSGELSWFVSPALTALTVDDGSGPLDVLAQTVDCNGVLSISPTVTTTYTLEGTGPLGTESLEVTIVVDEPAVVNSFSASFAEVPAGSSATLSWDVTNGTTVVIDNGVGAVDNITGSVDVVVEEATTFTLTATNSQGDVTDEVMVGVIVPSEPGLISHWKVGEAPGETEGTSLISESGAGFIGTFFGTPSFDTEDPAPVPGGSTASISFDGASSWVDVLNYSGIGGSESRTLAFWFKGPGSQTNANATLVGWGTGDIGMRFDTRIQGGASGIIRTEVAGSGSNGTAIIDDGGWHHCAVVLDPTIGTTIGEIQFYIDG